MENKISITPTFRSVHDRDVTTWKLPEGAIARLGTGWISGGMTFSPDGESLVVASTIGCWWYDLNTMKLSTTWDTGQGILCAIAISQDGKWLSTGSWNGTVKIWDTQNLECAASIDLPKSTNVLNAHSRYLQFSKNGKYITRSNLIARENGGGSHFTIYDWHTDIDTPIKSLSLQPEQGKAHIHPVALSPDGSLIAYTPEENITYVINMETGEIIARLRDNYTDTSTIGCYQLDFSPTGKYLAATNRGNKILIWNVNNGNLEMAPTVHSDSRDLEISVPAYTADGKLQVAGFSCREVVIWDANQQETLDTFESPRPISGSFSSNGSRFVATNRCGELQVWTQGNPPTVQSLPTHISRGVTSVKFSKNCRKLLSANDFSGYRLWDVPNERVQQKIQLAHPESPGKISVSKSRRLLAVLEDSRVVRVWDLDADILFAELNEKYQGVKWMTFSPCEEYLVTINIRKIINIWHLTSSKQIAELTQNPSRILRMGFSPNGEHFVSFYGDSFTIWDAKQWKKRLHIQNPIVQSEMQISKRWQLLLPRTNKHVIIVPREGSILVWDLHSGAQVGSLDTSICSDQSLYTGTSQDIQHFHEQPITSSNRIWGSLKSSPCGTRIAGIIRRTGKNEIRMWDSTTLETCMMIIPPTEYLKPQTAKFSPCGKYLAVGAQWQEGKELMPICLFDVNTGENMHNFCGHPTDIWALAFSPDGELLASGSYDGTILLWDMKPLINC